MSHILLKYDWRVMEGHEPGIGFHGLNLYADPKANLEIRRREEEVNIDTL